ncbi:hypothetical protein BJ993_002044 [Nocardioides aromaticivorans]|uniref:Uncharacterized protein n=1 Tax=Nocardioides aromaticivorans TaxID=200618 RepID=A0A7Y9ZGD3_9ACTN|nr:hypothetical protein [Nocardioides aromaticivorans]
MTDAAEQKLTLYATVQEIPPDHAAATPSAETS